MKLCCFFNYAPHYRYPIYKAIDSHFEPDWYFGDSVFENIKQFDYRALRGYKRTLHAKKIFSSYVWHTHGTPLFSRNYTHYLLTGSPSCLLNWLILLYSKIRGKKVYFWAHGLTMHPESRKARWLNKLFFCYSDGVFLYGKYAISFMIEIGCQKSKLHVIHNSLDTEQQSVIYKSLKRTNIYSDYFKNSNPTIVYIGRIQLRKKLDLLVDAVSLLKTEGFSVNIIFVGGVSDGIEEIKKRVAEKKLHQNVWFYGPCYDEGKNGEILYNASICVTPGSVGLTCIHSLSYGCPVISHDNFGIQMPEYEAIRPSVTGDFYSEGDMIDLAKKIKFWCSIDDAKRTACRKIARDTIVKEWSVAYQIDTIKAVIL